MVRRSEREEQLLEELIGVVSSNVKRNPIEVAIEYVDDNISKITITDRITNEKKVITFTYDVEGRLVKIEQEWQ